jgi:hypothetical protein
MFDLLSDRLSQHLEQIVRERNPFFSSQGHFYVREYLRQELGNWGKVESHFFSFQGKTYENLILDLPNNSQKTPILIGAHFTQTGFFVLHRRTIFKNSLGVTISVFP